MWCSTNDYRNFSDGDIFYGITCTYIFINQIKKRDGAQEKRVY